jgi:hypothetical protein
MLSPAPQTAISWAGRDSYGSSSREQLADLGWYVEMRGTPVVSVEGPADWPGTICDDALLSQLSRDPANRLLKSPQRTVRIKLANLVDLLAGNPAFLPNCGAYDVGLKVALLVQAVQQLRQPGTRPAWKM